MEDDRDLPCYLLQYHNRYAVWKLIMNIITKATGPLPVGHMLL